MKHTPLIVLPSVLALVAGCQNQKSSGESASGSSATSTSTSTPQVSTGSDTPPPPPTPQDQPPEVQRPAPPALPDPLPGKRTDLTAAIDKDGKGWRAVIADLDGDGKRELVVVDSKHLRVLDATGREISKTPVGGGILQLVAADLDGDKRSEVYAGWGQTRDHMDATARITAHNFTRGKLVEEVVQAPTTSRQEVTAIVPMPDEKALLVGYFDSKYMVTSTVLMRGAQGWVGQKLASLRTATSYARGDVDGNGSPDIVVGRVYGDDKGIDGDAFVLGADGARKVIPSTRGLRSIAVADSDGDGKPEVFMGDGWHQNYGQNAHGLLTWAKASKDGFTTELIEDTPGQFELMRIVPARIDGMFALVTLGSHYVRVFYRQGARWQGLTIAGASRDIAVGDLDGQPGDEIVVVGDKSELVNLRGALKP